MRFAVTLLVAALTSDLRWWGRRIINFHVSPFIPEGIQWTAGITYSLFTSFSKTVRKLELHASIYCCFTWIEMITGVHTLKHTNSKIFFFQNIYTDLRTVFWIQSLPVFIFSRKTASLLWSGAGGWGGGCFWELTNRTSNRYVSEFVTSFPHIEFVTSFSYYNLLRHFLIWLQTAKSIDQELLTYTQS